MKDWHCYSDNQAYGPYPENLLKDLIDRGQLTADTFVYSDSPEDAPKGWQRAGDTEIAALFLNNSQGTQFLPPIQTQWAAHVSPEASEENTENRRHWLSDEGEAQTFLSFLSFYKKLIAGLVGSIVLCFGVFCPIVSSPMLGQVIYFQRKGEGVIILVFAVISIIVTLIKKYKWLWLTGFGSLGVMLFTFVSFQMRMSEMKSELTGNPFGGLMANVAKQSVQLQWGWVILLFGAALVITAAALKEIAADSGRESNKTALLNGFDYKPIIEKAPHKKNITILVSVIAMLIAIIGLGIGVGMGIGFLSSRKL
jgi:hypothetical protein